MKPTIGKTYRPSQRQRMCGMGYGNILDAKNASQIFELKTQLRMKQGDREVMEYYTEMLGERRKVMLQEYLTTGPRLQRLVTRGPHTRSSPRQSKRTYCEHWSIRIYESITLNPVRHDLSSRKMIGSAKEREGLYYLTKLMCVDGVPACNSHLQRRMSRKRRFGHSRRASFGEAAHKSILKCIHIVSIKLFKPPRLSLKIRSSLGSRWKAMGYQGWLKVGPILMPINPNSEEGGYACRVSSLQFCCSTCPPVNENYHIKCKFLDGDQSKLFSGEEATIPPVFGPWMVELDETGNPDLI
ncbi:hypothetical protein AAG906_026084 [Vitis piasezkii]